MRRVKDLLRADGTGAPLKDFDKTLLAAGVLPADFAALEKEPGPRTT
jgi:hypothetical protein